MFVDCWPLISAIIPKYSKGTHYESIAAWHFRQQAAAEAAEEAAIEECGGMWVNTPSRNSIPSGKLT